MSQAPGAPRTPIPFETAHGHDPPLCTQFSVFLDNRVGKLYELVEIFDGQPLRIVALSVMDSSDYSVVRMVTTRSDKTRRLLREYRLPHTEADILVIELGENQRLTNLCLSLLAAELNIAYAYPLTVRPHGASTMGIHTDDQVLAGQILQRKGFRIVSENQLREAAGGDPPIA